jgi:hypothetical protein
MAKYKGRSVKLNKPFRTSGGRKKFAVYVKNNRTGRVQVVRFGDPNMKIKKNIPARKRSFMARHGAILKKVTGQKSLKPVYWAIKSWRKGFKA